MASHGEGIIPRESPYDILLSKDEQCVLEALARKYTARFCDVMRARAILLAAQGMENKEISQRLDMPRQMVSKWRKRFFHLRMAGLENLPRR